MSKLDTGSMEFTATKKGAQALLEWRKSHGDDAAIAVACGTLTAACAALVAICGEREAYKYIQRKADDILTPTLTR